MTEERTLEEKPDEKPLSKIWRVPNSWWKKIEPISMSTLHPSPPETPQGPPARGFGHVIFRLAGAADDLRFRRGGEG